MESTPCSPRVLLLTLTLGRARRRAGILQPVMSPRIGRRGPGQGQRRLQMGAESESLEWGHSGVLAGRALGVHRLRLRCGMVGFRGGTPDRVAACRGGIARSLGSLHVARDWGPTVRGPLGGLEVGLAKSRLALPPGRCASQSEQRLGGARSRGVQTQARSWPPSSAPWPAGFSPPARLLESACLGV